MDLSQHIEKNKNIIDPEYYHQYSQLQDRQALASWKRHKRARQNERNKLNKKNNELWNKRLNAHIELPDEYYGTPEELANEIRSKNIKMLIEATTPEKEDWSAFAKWLDNEFSKVDGISHFNTGNKI